MGVFTGIEFARKGWGTYKVEPGFALDIDALFLLAKHFAIGPVFKFAFTKPEGGSFNIYIMSVGVRASFPIYLGERFQIRPGLGFAFNVVRRDDISSIGYGINPFPDLDFAYAVNKNIVVLLGYSFISQPWGDYKGDRFTFYPASCIHAGFRSASRTGPRKVALKSGAVRFSGFPSSGWSPRGPGEGPAGITGSGRQGKRPFPQGTGTDAHDVFPPGSEAHTRASWGPGAGYVWVATAPSA